jgi:hypothetical protein
MIIIFFSFSSLKNLFIENQGQLTSEVIYYSFPTNAYILKDRIVINDIELIFKNINPNVKIRAKDMEIAVFNYFKGNEPTEWKRNIPSYSKIIYENIYKNIDLIFTGLIENRIEFQFIVKPKANVSDIAYEINCKECEIINKGNEILIKKEGREILSIENLKAYQGADEIEISFKNKGNTITYEVGKYNKNEILIIDPDLEQLMASTYLGGSASEEGRSIYLDQMGNVFVAGHTMSPDFPVTTKAYDNTFNGNWDVFISKLDNSLSSLLASTFLGGSSNDYARSIYLDNNGNVYITGATNSSNFPTTPNAYDNTFNGVYDGFISKLNNSLDSLLSSTFLGGSSIDMSNWIILDYNGNIYVTGGTSSSDFPVTSSAYDNTFNGNSDVFVSKLNNSLSQLLSSTFLGGSYNEVALSIKIDMFGNIYVAGSTYSPDFPITPGAYDGTCGTDGNCNYDGTYRYSDVFVSKLDSLLSQLISSTYLGGSSEDQANSMEIDYNGFVYVAGRTNSSNFPTTPNAYDNTFNGNSDGFISKLNNSLSQLVASTYIGGSNYDEIYSVYRGVYIAGFTRSSDFPTTSNAYDNTYNGYGDAFVSKFSDSLNYLLASTFLGGDTFDYIHSLYVASDGSVYSIGQTRSNNFPTTSNAYDTSFNGSNDVFISKLNGSASVFENPTTNSFKLLKNSIIFSIKKPSYIGINVYDLNGRLIRRISYGFVNSGIYEIKFNDLEQKAYLLKVRIGNEVKEVKFIKGG